MLEIDYEITELDDKTYHMDLELTKEQSALLTAKHYDWGIEHSRPNALQDLPLINHDFYASFIVKKGV